MISHKHKCFFIHIPKTAGMSIEQAFLSSLNLKFRNGQADELLLSYNEDAKKGPDSLAHLSSIEYLKFGYTTNEYYNDYFTFTFVRNPWSRAVSIYKHFQFHRMMSFKSFLIYEMPILEKEKYYFIKPQVEYFLDNDGKLNVDFIGRFESLTKDFDEIKTFLNYRVGDLHYINRSKIEGNIYSRWNMRYIIRRLKERPSRILRLNLLARKRLSSGKIYSKKCKDLVEQYYWRDIEYLEYSFPEDLSM